MKSWEVPKPKYLLKTQQKKKKKTQNTKRDDKRILASIMVKILN